MATMATTPNASVVTSPPTAAHAPMDMDSMNVAVMGPDATPPESNDSARKESGTKHESTNTPM